MNEQLTLTTENRQEWFEMLVAYMHMKTWAMWLRYYPDTPYKSFELLWPALFDQMLALATATAVKTLKDQAGSDPN